MTAIISTEMVAAQHAVKNRDGFAMILTKKTSCIERCGDGIRLVDQCDDKNKNNGDGCSSDCKI